MEIIGQNKEDKELFDFSVSENELKQLQDAYEIEKERRDSNYEFEDFCGEVIMLSAYHHKHESKQKEYNEKIQELKEIQKEISDAFDKELELMNEIESKRTY